MVYSNGITELMNVCFVFNSTTGTG